MKSQRHILVFTYWQFNEALVQSYTLPYLPLILKAAGPGCRITLITLERKRTKPVNLSGNIRHLPLHVGLFSITQVLRWFRIFIRLRNYCKKENITSLHAWCTPAGAMAYIVSRMTRLPMVIDSYEPHAEAMVENGTWKKNSSRFKLLFRFEKKMSHRAKHLIAASPYMAKYAEAKYGLKSRKMPVKPACVDLDLFNPVSRKNKEVFRGYDLQNKIICVYAGKLGGIYYESEVFSFWKHCADYWGDRFRVVLLGNYTEEFLAKQCEHASLSRSIIIQKSVRHGDVPAYIAHSTFGLTPVKPVPTKKCCTPIKDGEYWACGIPVLITRDISVDSELIRENNCGVVIEDFKEQYYDAAIAELDSLIHKEPAELAKRCRALAERHRNFIIAEGIYKEIYG